MRTVDYTTIFKKEMIGVGGKLEKLDNLEIKIKKYESTLTDNVGGSNHINKISTTILTEIKANINESKKAINSAVDDIKRL